MTAERTVIYRNGPTDSMTGPDPDPDAVKRALARLAAGDDRRVRTVARAVAAVDDLSAAAAFAESGGVERLRAVLAEVSEPDPAGRRALGAFERYRNACRREGRARDLGADGKDTGD
jgi:hypothetical protein